MVNRLISVIVPVYNTKEYLERCVSSLQAQTYSPLEIILVDDGSTDGTGGLCDELALKDTRIRVHHKENGGSSSARNLGIAVAKGEYLGFVDSDDYVEPDMYERLYEGLCRFECKVAQVGRDEITPEGEILPDICIPPEEAQCIQPEDFLKELLMHRGDCSFCTKLIARDVFYAGDKLRGELFPVGVLNEDFHLLIQLLEEMGPIVSLPGHSYHVYYRLGSNSRKGGRDDFSRVFADNVDNADMAEQIVKEKYPKLATVAFRFGIFQRIDYMLHIPISQMTKENETYRHIVKQLRKNWAKAMVNPVLTGKNKVYHSLFVLAPKPVRQVHAGLMKLKNPK